VKTFALDKLRTGTEKEQIAVLVELDRNGFFWAPTESLDQYIERIESAQQMLEELTSDPELRAQLDGAKEVPTELKDAANKLLEEDYHFRMDWLPAWYSSKQTGRLSAGIQLAVDGALPMIFLNSGFERRQRYRRYDAKETLAHELVHAARIAFSHSAYDEYFPCQTSSSGFRRFVGNFFRCWEIPTLFFGSLLIAVCLGVLYIQFWPLFLLPPIAILLREFLLRYRIRAAEKFLWNAGIHPNAILRLDDAEIKMLANAPPDDLVVGRFIEKSLRWKMLGMRFGIKTPPTASLLSCARRDRAG
jgi:hypothetical protein